MLEKPIDRNNYCKKVYKLIIVAKLNRSVLVRLHFGGAFVLRDDLKVCGNEE